jgi:predicted amidohydrolase
MVRGRGKGSPRNRWFEGVLWLLLGVAAARGGPDAWGEVAPARKVRVSVVAQRWCDEDRTLEAVLAKIDEAARDGADLVALPQECVKTPGEPLPGPISNALAERARQHHLYVIGNIREKDGGKTFVTSFLCDRQGHLVGKYRKSHKMPDEDMDLGDELPVFPTDFGPIAMRIGTDRFFPDIDHVYTAKGARIIFWAQMPEPVEDEYSQDFPSAGRAADYQVFIACSRYAAGKPGYLTNMYPPYCGFPIGRAYVIDREGNRIASTPRTGGGVATATIPVEQLQPGRGPNPHPAFAVLTAPVQLPEKKQYAKRRIRVTIIEAHLGLEDLLRKLDEAGKIGSDIVCLYEFVWITGGDPQRVEEMTRQARQNLAQIAAKAREHRMYVLIAGVVDRLERNEAILFGRDGQEVGRYFKIAKTHDEQICGEETPILETDFGRIGVRICADEWMVELDRCYGIKGADILFTPTQSWGPDALFRDLRDLSRAMDAQLFLVECTHPSSEVRHRSLIVEPTGVVVARSEYQQASLVSAVIDLDQDRPRRYLRRYTPHTPSGYLPEYQPDQMPQSANDLREVILAQRRPELYGILAGEASGPK